jgi:hypothetical protein
MEYEEIPVECYSGHKGNERPLVFIFQGRRWEVSEILDRWYEGSVKSDRPVLDYFKVRTTDGRVFILRYGKYSDRWSIRIER